MSPPKPKVEVRVFEMGASAIGLDDFLHNLGYKVLRGGGTAHTVRVSFPGSTRLKAIHRNQLMDIMDAERIKAGLIPIKKRAKGWTGK